MQFDKVFISPILLYGNLTQMEAVVKYPKILSMQNMALFLIIVNVLSECAWICCSELFKAS